MIGEFEAVLALKIKMYQYSTAQTLLQRPKRTEAGDDDEESSGDVAMLNK